MERWIAGPLGLICVVGVGWLAFSDAQSSGHAKPSGGDQMAIYETVLEDYLEGVGSRQLVDTRLGAAPGISDADVRTCARALQLRTDSRRHPALKSLAGAQFRRQGVELIDGATWTPLDPGLAIPRGKSVDEAVAEAFSHSLISFSQVSFSRNGRDALVDISMSCGALCGSGSTLRLHRNSDRWAIVEHCVQWFF